MFTAEKVGEPMRVAIRPDEARAWFGVTPPDLTIIARARASSMVRGRLAIHVPPLVLP